MTSSNDPFQGAAASKITYTFHDSIAREVIMIDENSLNLLIRDYTAGKETLKDAIGYLMTAAAITLTFATSNFHNDFLLEASVWKAVFLICDVILIGKAVKGFWDYWNSKVKTPDDFIKTLKEKSVVQSKTTATFSSFS